MNPSTIVSHRRISVRLALGLLAPVACSPPVVELSTDERPSLRSQPDAGHEDFACDAGEDFADALRIARGADVDTLTGSFPNASVGRTQALTAFDF